MKPASLIEKPKGSVEVIEKRTLGSKTFAMGGGKFKLRKMMGAIHYKEDLKNDNEQWKETDLTLEDKGDKFVINKAPYNLEILKSGLEIIYSSKQSGIVRIKLKSVGDKQVSKFNLNPVVDDVNSKIVWSNVIQDFDIRLDIKSAGIQFFKKIANANVSKEWEWEIEEDKDINLQINAIHKGIDEDGDKIRLKKEILNEQIIENKKSYILKETFFEQTIQVKDSKTRIKEFVDKIKYPLVIDVPDITELIVNNADDGNEMFSFGSDYGWYYTNSTMSGFAINTPSTYRGLGFRFQTIGVPQGATIDLANLKLQVKNINFTPEGYIYADDVDNAGAWGAGTAAPRNITKTTAKTAWAPSSTGWNTITVTDIVQEIVNRTGWASSNNIKFAALATEQGGAQKVDVYDYAKSQADAAILEIDYTVAGGATNIVQNII